MRHVCDGKAVPRGLVLRSALRLHDPSLCSARTCAHFEEGPGADGGTRVCRAAGRQMYCCISVAARCGRTYAVAAGWGSRCWCIACGVYRQAHQGMCAYVFVCMYMYVSLCLCVCVCVFFCDYSVPMHTLRSSIPQLSLTHTFTQIHSHSHRRRKRIRWQRGTSWWTRRRVLST